MVFSARDGWIRASAPRHRRPRERRRNREIETERREGEAGRGRGQRREVLRRCAVTDDPYFQMYCIPPVLLSALVCSASSEIPVATACRRSGSRVMLCAAWKKTKDEEEEEEDEEETAVEGREGEAKTKRATAITSDERRKNDSCINTARVYIFMCRLAMLSFRRAR